MGSGIEDAETYNNNSKLQWNIAIDTINSITWEGTEQVIDIGCGDGKITAFLAQKLSRGSIIGIDISQKMIDFALSNYPDKDLPNLSFQKLDALEIIFENRFDRVVSFSALHWVMDQEKVLQTIHKALKKGGMACIQIYAKGCMNITVIADSLIRTKKWASYFPSYIKQRVFFTNQEYEAIFKNAGFENISVIEKFYDTPFANKQDLFNFIKPLLNFISHLSIELQQEFIQEVVENIISIADISDDGVIHYQISSLQAIGFK